MEWKNQSDDHNGTTFNASVQEYLPTRHRQSNLLKAYRFEPRNYKCVVIVGNGAVGKSSMIQRYCKGTFTKDYKKTIGVDFLERQIE
uniref:Uncharacterized protein n=1 Tax=Timema monikensis TaxID=170555 RepID=A0A7R9E8N4_9NEOP|nr:unnamed protein product [Timema monikensis]